MESEPKFNQDYIPGVPTKDGPLLNMSKYFRGVVAGVSMVAALGGVAKADSQETDPQQNPANQEQMESGQKEYDPYSYEAAEDGPYSLIFQNPDRTEFLKIVRESLMEDLSDNPTLIEKILSNYVSIWDAEKTSFEKLSPQDREMFKAMWDQKIQPGDIEVAPDEVG